MLKFHLQITFLKKEMTQNHNYLKKTLKSCLLAKKRRVKPTDQGVKFLQYHEKKGPTFFGKHNI
jgi:hypothetical protein